MKKYKIYFVIWFVLMTESQLHAGGKQIEVIDTTGKSVSGELLAVRPGELLVCMTEGLDDEELANDGNGILKIPRESISIIKIEGKSYTLIGGGIGLAIGVGVGLIAASESVDKSNAPSAVLSSVTLAPLTLGVCAIGGLLVGLAAGSVASVDDVEMRNPQKNDLMIFKQYARYNFNEPKFLKAID